MATDLGVFTAASPTVGDGVVYQPLMNKPSQERATAPGLHGRHGRRDGRRELALQGGGRSNRRRCSPTASIYFGTFDDNLYALDAETGEEALDVQGRRRHQGRPGPRRRHDLLRRVRRQGVRRRCAQRQAPLGLVGPGRSRGAGQLLRHAGRRLRARLHREHRREGVRLRREGAATSSGRGARAGSSTRRPPSGTRRCSSAPTTAASTRSTPHGDVRWTFRRQRAHLRPATVLARSSTSRPSGTKTYALDASSGKQVWTFPDGRYAGVVADADRVYLTGSQTVYALEPSRVRAAADRLVPSSSNVYEGKTVAVVVPAYNEEALVGSTVAGIPTVCRPHLRRRRRLDGRHGRARPRRRQARRGPDEREERGRGGGDHRRLPARHPGQDRRHVRDGCRRADGSRRPRDARSRHRRRRVRLREGEPALHGAGVGDHPAHALPRERDAVVPDEDRLRVLARGRLTVRLHGREPRDAEASRPAARVPALRVSQRHARAPERHQPARARLPVAPDLRSRRAQRIRLRRVVPRISWLLIKGFFWRLREKYIIRDFHPLVLFYTLGFLLFGAGVVLGIVETALRFAGNPIPVATIVLVALFVISGLQLSSSPCGSTWSRTRTCASAAVRI